jgi:hypothetical protein
MNRRSGSGLGLWLVWALLSALGSALGIAIGFGLSERFRLPLNSTVGEAAFGFLALGGIFAGIGIAQWLLLRRYVNWATRWLFASGLGGALGGVLGLTIYQIIGGELGGVLGWAAVLTGIGLTQWLLLRERVPLAGGLALASAIAWIAAGPASALVPGPMVVGGAIFGAVHGGITGAVVTWLVLKKGKPAEAMA